MPEVSRAGGEGLVHELGLAGGRLRALAHMIGGGAPDIESRARDVVWSRGKVKLYRYRGHAPGAPPLLIVYSLATRSYVFDLGPGNSFVESLLDRGHDVYLIDWGVPDVLDAHLGLEDYVGVLLPRMVEAVHRLSGGQDVQLLGYCLGGLLSLLYSALHDDAPLAGLAVMATPVDFRHVGPVGRMLRDGRVDPASLLDASGNVPAYVVRNAFRIMQPAVEVIGWANLLQHGHDDAFVRAFRTMTRWGNDHVPLTGGVVRDLAEIARSDTLPSGRAWVAGRQADLTSITVPFLSVIGTRDHLVPPKATSDLCALVGSPDATSLELDAGHIGLFLGSSAQRRCVPRLSEWFAGKPLDDT